jgi:hypothetical protein
MCISPGVRNLAVNGTTTYTLNTEYGNPSTSMFNGGFLDGQDNSGLGASWTRSVLILRGCMTGTGSNASTVSATVQVTNNNGALWTALTAPFNLTDHGAMWSTNTSPPFSLGTYNTNAVLGIKFNSTSSSNVSTNYCLGSVWATFLA